MNISINLLPLILIACLYAGCKKEEEETKNMNCKLTQCYIEGILLYSNEYNKDGKIEKATSYYNSEITSYTIYIYTDTMVIEQNYDATGIKSDFKTTYILGKDGYANQMIYYNGIKSDTTFYTQNNEGYLINKRIGSYEYKYMIKNGNTERAEEFDGGELSGVITYEYYTDQPYSASIIEKSVPLGKSDRNLLKKMIYDGESFDLDTDYKYEFNSDGYISRVIFTSDSTDKSIFDLKYQCK